MYWIKTGVETIVRLNVYSYTFKSPQVCEQGRLESCPTKITENDDGTKVVVSQRKFYLLKTEK